MKTPAEKAAALEARARAALKKAANEMFHVEIFHALIELYEKQDSVSRDELVADLQKRADDASNEYKADACRAAAQAFADLK